MSSVERRSIAKSTQPGGVALQDRDCQFAPALEAPCITILLCTYNGERFLAAQLASIEQQSYRNWRLIVSDDHSSDATLAILRHFAQRTCQPVEIREGPQLGPAANFLSLAADPEIAGEYFAFCDQDDVWHRDKLRRALSWATSLPQELPVVYGGRTNVICAAGKPLGYSSRFFRPPSFGNALVQNIAGANTMLFNSATKRLFEQAGPLHVTAHDWWAYQLVSGSGGVVGYDPEPHVDYRQHANNRIGSNKGLRAQCKRLRLVFQGRFSAWNDVNLAALENARHLLTEEARALVDAFQVMRKGSFVARLTAFATSPLRRQTSLGNLALLLATALKKV
jgi:glycosyltransferase involved in cell wall biosynthesis